MTVSYRSFPSPSPVISAHTFLNRKIRWFTIGFEVQPPTASRSEVLDCIIMIKHGVVVVVVALWVDTDLTRVRSFSRMYSSVLAKSRQLPKALATRITMEVPFVSVCGQVTHQSVLVLELTTTWKLFLKIAVLKISWPTRYFAAYVNNDILKILGVCPWPHSR